MISDNFYKAGPANILGNRMLTPEQKMPNLSSSQSDLCNI